MKQTKSAKEKFRQLLLILVPILVTQIAMSSIGFFDIMMTGKYSPVHLAGVAVGSSIWMPVFTGLSGILLSVTPIVAHLIGAGQRRDVRVSVMQGIYAGAAMALLIIGIGALLLDPLLNAMHLEPEVRRVAKLYLLSLSFGMIPLFVYNVLRSFIDALGKTRVTMIVTLMSLPINVLFNYLFIFGAFGFPEWGGIGAGIASAITYWLITLIAVLIIHRTKPFLDFKVFAGFQRVSFEKWKEIFILGVPIGLAIFFETSIFSAVTLFMSNFGTNIIAAHQSALNFSSMLYMIPLSISMALTILVGFETGAKRLADARSYSYLGIGTAVALSSFLGLMLLIFRSNIATLYSDEQGVVDLIARFLLYAVFFQLSDAVLAPIQGTLRGYKDVNVTFLMALLSFWIIGLPLGYALAHHTDMGPYGYWLGLITGLAVGAVALAFRLSIVQRRMINKLEKEQA